MRQSYSVLLVLALLGESFALVIPRIPGGFKASEDATLLPTAVDINFSVTTGMFQCLKNNNYQAVFVRVWYPYGPGGSFDNTAIQNINNAYTENIAMEVYMVPKALNTNVPTYKQFENVYDTLRASGIIITRIWVGVFDQTQWTVDFNQNVAMIQSIIDRAKLYGVTVGIYTNHNQWNLITGGYKGLTSDVLLWYSPLLGTTGKQETPNDFSDFRPFGSWTAPSVKQYSWGEFICAMTVSRDVYDSSLTLGQNNMVKPQH